MDNTELKSLAPASETVRLTCDRVRASVLPLIENIQLALDRHRQHAATCRLGVDITRMNREVDENLVLALRHAEDARMRLGKVLQAMDGGVAIPSIPPAEAKVLDDLRQWGEDSAKTKVRLGERMPGPAAARSDDSVTANPVIRLTTTLRNCPRCGRTHEKLAFSALANPPHGNAHPTYTQWATCPTTGSPILFGGDPEVLSVSISGGVDEAEATWETLGDLVDAHRKAKTEERGLRAKGDPRDAERKPEPVTVEQARALREQAEAGAAAAAVRLNASAEAVDRSIDELRRVVDDLPPVGGTPHAYQRSGPDGMVFPSPCKVCGEGPLKPIHGVKLSTIDDLPPVSVAGNSVVGLTEDAAARALAELGWKHVASMSANTGSDPSMHQHCNWYEHEGSYRCVESTVRGGVIADTAVDAKDGIQAARNWPVPDNGPTFDVEAHNAKARAAYEASGRKAAHERFRAAFKPGDKLHYRPWYNKAVTIIAFRPGPESCASGTAWEYLLGGPDAWAHEINFDVPPVPREDPWKDLREGKGMGLAEPPVSNDGGRTVMTSVKYCSVCGGDHINLKFDRLGNLNLQRGYDPSGRRFTHWATCPSRGDPLLIAIRHEL